jgi:hypothetical protein
MVGIDKGLGIARFCRVGQLTPEYLRHTHSALSIVTVVTIRPYHSGGFYRQAISFLYTLSSHFARLFPDTNTFCNDSRTHNNIP